MISATTSAAAAIPTSEARSRSTFLRVPAAPVSASVLPAVISAICMASPDVAGVFLQQRPGLIAELGLGVLVEGGLGKGCLEGLRIGGVEGQALRLQNLLLIGAGLDDVVALFLGGNV